MWKPQYVLKQKAGGEKLLSRCAQSQIELEAVVPTATGFKGRVRAVIMQRWRNMPGAATAA